MARLDPAIHLFVMQKRKYGVDRRDIQREAALCGGRSAQPRHRQQFSGRQLTSSCLQL
jgi:hypothetical protein